jgi:hypothetical protein
VTGTSSSAGAPASRALGCGLPQADKAIAPTVDIETPRR